MRPLHAVLLGLLQGATEFIPISSSGHLVLVPWLLGWPEPGLAFDTVVHWGTLVAVAATFWHDLVVLSWAWLWGWRTRSWPSPEGRLAWLLLLGTLPAIVLGLLLEDWFEALFSAPAAVSGFLIATGLLLMVSERLGRRESGEEKLCWRDALLIGLGQAAAIAPGISRSGATMAVGLLRGMRREAAARFSFLLAIPVILGAGMLQLAKLAMSGQVEGEWPTLALGFVTAAASGYVCVRFLLRYLRRRSLYPFTLYCCAAGLAALSLSYGAELVSLSTNYAAERAALSVSWSLAPPAESGPPSTPSELVIGGPEALHPLMRALARAYQSRRPHIVVIVENVGAAFPDLGFAYRETGEGHDVPVALDALAIIVHPSNHLQELTMLEVQGIFAGRSYDWEPLGGQPGEIKVLDQMDGTPSQRFFAEQVMKSRRVTPSALLMPNDGAVVAEVALDPLAIGYASVGYLNPEVRPLVIEGIFPMPENLGRGTYHLLRPVYLGTRGRPSGEAQRFVDFVLSEEGQAVVMERYGGVEIVRTR
jgi:undecaprenyl-diphosphatase